MYSLYSVYPANACARVCVCACVRVREAVCACVASQMQIEGGKYKGVCWPVLHINTVCVRVLWLRIGRGRPLGRCRILNPRAELRARHSISVHTYPRSHTHTHPPTHTFAQKTHTRTEGGIIFFTPAGHTLSTRTHTRVCWYWLQAGLSVGLH